MKTVSLMKNHRLTLDSCVNIFYHLYAFVCIAWIWEHKKLKPYLPIVYVQTYDNVLARQKFKTWHQRNATKNGRTIYTNEPPLQVEIKSYSLLCRIAYHLLNCLSFAQFGTLLVVCIVMVILIKNFQNEIKY